jgi:hypothetical protein
MGGAEESKHFLLGAVRQQVFGVYQMWGAGSEAYPWKDTMRRVMQCLLWICHPTQGVHMQEERPGV